MNRPLSPCISAFFCCALLFLSCSKDNKEQTRLGQPGISNITRTSVYCSESLSGNTSLIKGFCLDTLPNPSLLHALLSKTVAGNILADTIRGLRYSTLYYIRGYVIAGKDTLYSEQGSFTTLGAITTAGQEYGGGYAFYIDSTGEHGLIAAPYDVGRYKWQNCPLYVFSENPDSRWYIGSGKSNTQRIIDSIPAMNAICGAYDSIAAQVCSNLVMNGYDDWFLPSFDELNAFRRYCFDHPLFPNGLGMDFYWSSTEGSTYTAGMLGGPNTSNNGNTMWDKTWYMAVRPVRSF